MKNIFALLLIAGLFTFTSCKNDGSKVEAEANESLAVAGDAGASEAVDLSEANPAEAVPTGPTTTLEFAETTYDFGTIKDGEKATYSYKFTNTGKEPLIISNAKGSCGCTVPDWPRDPIAPGKTGEIKVVFDSKGKGSVDGQSQSKRVTLTANTDPVNTYLNIKGIVTKDAEAQ